MSFPKMWSSLDPRVCLEMSGGTTAQQERGALAQPVVAPSCQEMWQLWASLSQQLHCLFWGGESRNVTNLQRGLILLARQCESISLYSKLAGPITTWVEWQSLQEKTTPDTMTFLCSLGFFGWLSSGVFLITIIKHINAFHKVSKPVLCIFTNLHAHLNYISLWIWKILSLSCQSNGI